MTTTTTRRPHLGTTPVRNISLADVTNTGSGLPNRYILHGLEKVGKTSFAAYAPKPVFIQTRGETGLETLIEANRLPKIPHFPELMAWEELRAAVGELITGDHDYKCLVIDTFNGAERLCHEHVCQTQFGGDWGERGFSSFQKGYDVSQAVWLKFLGDLDALRSQRKMAILALCHTRVKNFKNPEGADYDRYVPDMHEKTWGLSHKWADAVLFVNFETFVNEKNPEKKGKATGSKLRIMHTERDAAYDAGNRLGLPPELELGNSGEEAWKNFSEALVKGRKGGSE